MWVGIIDWKNRLFPVNIKLIKNSHNSSVGTSQDFEAVDGS